MTLTPNLALPYIEAAQAQKHVTHNEALRSLDVLVQTSVLTRTLASPPASPAEGACYIISGVPAGLWAGQSAGSIAAWQDGQWVFFPPKVGWVAWVVDEATIVSFTGASWQVLGAPSSLPLLGINATADATNRLAVKSPAVLLDNVGGGVQAKINKASSTDTASLLYQHGYSGRAEMGLAGDDDLHIKVSADGAAWKEAVRIDRTSGLAQVAGDPLAPLGIATRRLTVAMAIVLGG